MGVYIPNVQFPKDGWLTLRIYPTGEVARPNWQGDCTFISDAIFIPDHGDLVDRSPLEVLSWKMDEVEDSFCAGVTFVCDKLDALPVVIPAEGEDYT